MNRFIKVFALLLVSLFAVASGVNAALDRLAKAPLQSSFTVYSDKGAVLVTYNGDLNLYKAFPKPNPIVVPSLLHRT